MEGLERNSLYMEEKVLSMTCKWTEVPGSCNTYSTLGMATTDCQLTAACEFYRNVMNIDIVLCRL
jgi:hypothetical protein